ncbi:MULTISPECIES: SRPBCC family protein [unclassified Streptomyces]|uniref:SRPBCC family protein n=1 Tax=unclassified Streptomyces TaxID=2593676 RepID=UPI002238332F|nr:SRPBCC family protein [Streptomyces sp. SHP 1-2]MCW5252504.1 SRPBCC family protein [Streptomyces sp. SHP 1-2]
MARRWYPIEEADDSLFASAPLYHARSVEVPFSPEETWAALVGDGVSSWTKGMRQLTWTSPRPFGVGTTREIEMNSGLVLRERFYRWEEGTRKTFAAVEGTSPIFRRLVEDYVVEPSGSGSRFSWRWAAELNRPYSFVGGALDRFFFAPTGRSHIDGLPAHMAARRRDPLS